MSSQQNNPISRPDVFAYHDYRKLLKDWLVFKKKKEGQSLRSIVKAAGLSVGYLPMVVQGSRKMSQPVLSRLARPLGFNASELRYVECLVEVVEGQSQADRSDALARLHRFGAYRKQNPKETEAIQYLSRWYYVAIREMAALEGFHPDARWIQARLRPKVSLHEVEEALRFLTVNGFISAEKEVRCEGSVFLAALTQFHRQMLGVASESLQLSADQRTVMGHTLALPANKLQEVTRILSEALDRVAAQEKTGSSKDVVYHVLVAAVPLTQKKREEPR